LSSSISITSNALESMGIKYRRLILALGMLLPPLP
jgi:hypothetical protein